MVWLYGELIMKKFVKDRERVGASKYSSGNRKRFCMVACVTALLTISGCSDGASSSSSLLEICEEIGNIIESSDGKKQSDQDMKRCLGTGKQLALVILDDLRTYVEQEKQMIEMGEQMNREEQEALAEWEAKKNKQ
jgi:hypothetical protein